MALPIRVRLTIWYCVVLGLILLVTGALVVLEVQVNLRNATDQELRLAASEITVDYHVSGSESEFRDVTDASLGGLPADASAAQLLTPSGTIVEQAGAPLGPQPRPLVGHPVIAQALTGQPVFATATLGGASYRVLAVPFRKGNGLQALVVATSLARAQHAARRLLVALLIAGAVGLVLAAGSGWWLARRALQPVARMTAQAGSIGTGGSLTERIQVPKAADELHQLAQTLNGMLTRLDQAVTRQRRFVANVSHELRTPLTVMRSELDVSLASSTLSQDAREVLESTREEAEQMTSILENVLTLARIDEEEELHLIRRPCDLREVAQATARQLRPIAEQHRVSIRLNGSRGPVLADPERLGQVVRNLLDNAIRYSPPGGTVIVEIANHGGQAELAVRDEGPGIDPAVLEHVFERFYRGDPARPRTNGGSGLGLAICREIAEAHGGGMSATSAIGQGSTFRLTLPALSGRSARPPITSADSGRTQQSQP
jgi:two-component system, OmpR family, sensor kinase